MIQTVILIINLYQINMKSGNKVLFSLTYPSTLTSKYVSQNVYAHYKFVTLAKQNQHLLHSLCHQFQIFLSIF